MPADMDWYKASTEPLMEEYYRMKEKLKALEEQIPEWIICLPLPADVDLFYILYIHLNNIDWTDTPMPADMDWYKASTEPLMDEYYRMKEKLKAKIDRFQNE